MKRFGYVRDPLCVIACGLYALNVLWLRRHLGGTFLTGYFDDLLLIPAALPFLLWLQRRIGLRADDGHPRWNEILLHLVAWSFVAEVVTPHLVSRATGDWKDVIAYTAGGVVAGCWWQAPTR